MHDSCIQNTEHFGLFLYCKQLGKNIFHFNRHESSIRYKLFCAVFNLFSNFCFVFTLTAQHGTTLCPRVVIQAFECPRNSESSERICFILPGVRRTFERSTVSPLLNDVRRRGGSKHVRCVHAGMWYTKN